MKGIYVTIFSSQFAGGGVLRGVSEAVLIGPDVPPEREAHADLHPPVHLVTRRGGEIVIEPIERYPEKLGPMYGGRIAEVRGHGFVRVFDYFETPSCPQD